MNEELLRIVDLILSFRSPQGDVPAVRGVSLNVKAGETLALVGESGCGKTAICREILRLHSGNAIIEQGSIFLCGQNILELTEEEMEKVRGRDASMVFQDPMSSLNPTFSIGKQIMEAITAHEKISKIDAKERTIELLKQVGIKSPEERFSQYPHHFSGGMRQRVAIAIALACNPKLLVADEPTTSLDMTTQNKIIELIKQLAYSNDRGMIFVTHDLGLVENIADRVAVMNSGKIVETGPTDQIFEDPQNEYTKRLLSFVNYGKGKGHVHGLVHFHNGEMHSHSADGMVHNTEPIVTVKCLTKRFEMNRKKSLTVLKNYNMDIYKGEILGVIGDSGCGKSTLARCIMGIYEPTDGTITIAPHCAKQMIFQDSASAFNPRMKIKDIIAEPLVINGKYGSKKELNDRVIKAMERVELETSLANRFPYDVSGGQRQRAAIARAIITGPDLLIADEPISSLDVSIQSQIVHLLKSIRDEKNMTMMIIAHDLPMIAHISDRIINLSIANTDSSVQHE